MKKRLLPLIMVVLVIGTTSLLNLTVTTQQGVNYQQYTIKMPLYLKIIDFFDRHYNYQQLIKRIIENTRTTDEEMVMKLFRWTYENIKDVPDGFPIIDDHVWHIIVRGYGTSDQSNDVFSTLCNYAGRKSFYAVIYKEGKNQGLPFSLVKIGTNWHVFDAFNGAYFLNSKGNLASVGEVISGNSIIKFLSDSIKKKVDYSEYLSNLPDVKSISMMRSNIQSPLRRFFYKIKKLFGQKKPT